MSTFKEDFDRALSWDEEIEKESEFVIIPEGIYDFEVTGFQRGVHNGSEKLPPCNKAILTIKVTTSTGDTTSIIHNLFLHSKTEGLLSAFFISIGEKKHGEKFRMNFSNVIGKKGRCKVFIDTYNGNQSNKIKSFLEPKKETKTYGGF